MSAAAGRSLHVKAPDHYLLSKVIPRNNVDGYYPFHSSVWLLHNEGFRREFARWNRSMSSFDPVTYPWKAVAIYRWLAEYHLPVIRHWENLKRLYLVPHYGALGYTAPSAIVYTADFLVENFERIISLAKSICNMTFADESSPRQIKDLVSKLKGEMQFVHHVLLLHYTEEERYWPTPFEREGMGVWNKCLAKMMFSTWRQKYHVGDLYLAFMLHVVGHNITRTPDDHLDIPYCGPRVKMEIIQTVPFVVRALPLVQWMKRYILYKTMINSVNGVDDLLELEAQYRKLAQRNHCSNRLSSAFWPFRKAKTTASAKIMCEEAAAYHEHEEEDTTLEQRRNSFRTIAVDEPVANPDNIHRELMSHNTQELVAQDAAAVEAAVNGRISMPSSSSIIE